MPDTCVIRAGEIVLLDDARLNDPNCSIEPGVIIRPPVDESTIGESVVEKPVPKKVTKAAPKVEPPLPAVEASPPLPPIPQPVATVKKPPVASHTEVADPPAPNDGADFGVTPEAMMLAAGAAVVAVGGAAAGSAMGGFSAIQTKIASLFGSKASVAAAVTVTAGTIVAVKALESKMSGLEKDMKRAKDDVDGAASSIDRIDQLLSRLGGDNDDELDPSV